MRDRLIELLKSPHKAEHLLQTGVNIWKYEDDCIEAMIADYLLANGVIVPKHKVGDTIYYISSAGLIIETKIESVGSYADGAMYTADGCHLLTTKFFDEERGKSYYDTRAEAEKALAERKGGE